MANVRSANTFYIDTVHSSSSDDLVIKNIKLIYLIISATSANAQIVLADATTGDKKVDLRAATSGSSYYVRFDENPVVFANGIKVATLTNAVATAVIEESRG